MEVNRVKNKVLLISVVLVLVAGLVLASCAPAAEGPAPAGPAPAAEEHFEWSFVGAYPRNEPGFPIWQKYISDAVEEASGGRLKIKLYSDGELMKATEVLDACSVGTIEMESSVGAYWRGKDPLWDFNFMMPYSWRGGDEYEALMDSGLRDLLAEMMAEDYNLRLLNTECYGHHVLYLNKPVRKVSDFKGLKLRDTGTILDLYEDLGASTVFLAGSEIYTALQLGTIDGAGWNSSGWEDMHFDEVCEYILLPPVGSNCGHVSVNIDAWNSLPDDLQYILQSACDKSGRMQEIWKVQNERRLLKTIMEEEPERVIVMPDEEVEKIRDAASRVWDKTAAKSPRCAEATEIMRSYLEEHGAMVYEWPIK